MQRMLSLLVALALLIIPMGMISAAAVPHADSAHAAMAAPGECHKNGPAPEEKSKGVGMSAECALACAALPTMPVRMPAPAVAMPVLHDIVALHGLAGAGPESLDPPPRA